MASDAARKIVQEYRALQDRMKTMRKEFTTASKDIFKEEVKPLFEKFPKLVSFSWNQYTPYFNDGDPCTFRCNASDPEIQYGEIEEREESYGWKGKQGEAAAAVEEFLSTFSDEQYEMMFDDHAQIIVTRQGVEVEEYDHD